MTTTTGWCHETGREHHVCAGNCTDPQQHACDSPCPDVPGVRCFLPIGHGGKCAGINGPAWETPEPYASRDPLPDDWPADHDPRPWERARPATEQTLEAYTDG